MSKKARNPSEPKRPVSAYLAFCSEQRKKMQGEIGNLPIKDQARKFGEMWKELTEEQKETYFQEFRARNEEYKKAYEAYKLTPEYKASEELKVEEKEKMKKERRGGEKRGEKKKKNKRVVSAYNVFTAEEYENFKKAGTDTQFSSFAATLSAKWRSMSDSDKEVYKKKAEEKQKLKEQENVKNSE